MSVRITLNGEARQVPPGATIETLLASLPDPSGGNSSPHAANGRGVAVAIDGTVVPRGAWPTTELVDGARVEVVAAVQGG